VGLDIFQVRRRFTSGVERKIRKKKAIIPKISLKNSLVPPRFAQKISKGLSRGSMKIFNLCIFEKFFKII